MVKAAEIRKRVREAEAERVKARAEAAVEVGSLHEKVATARAALTAAEADLRKAVKAATGNHGYTISELSQVTGVGSSALRAAQPETASVGSNGQLADSPVSVAG